MPDMRATCFNAQHMSKMIQVRNVPDDLHRTLKVRAAQSGMTLSDFVLNELTSIVGKPTLAELSDRIAARERVDIGDLGTEIIRQHRGEIP